AILDTGKVKEEALTKALAATPAKHTAVVELLKKAGAKPPAPSTEAAVDPDLLAAYAGSYRSDNQDVKIAVEEGKLTAQFGAGPANKLQAIDKVSFKSADGAVTIIFRRESDKVTGLTVKFDKTEIVFRRVDPAKEPTPGTATVE